jgi:L-malate glycosyltransferase
MKMKKISERLHVLYMPRWYPNRYDPMPGLFIERHGLSVLPHCDVSVLYVHSDDQLVEPKYDIIQTNEKGLFTVKVYFRKSTCKIGVLANLCNAFRFFKANRKGYHIIKQKVRKADIVHVHVLTRLGILALANKVLNGTPYLITEHWTRYLHSTNTYHGFFRKLATRTVAKRASAILPVTANLRDAMIDNGLTNNNYQVIPNVVDVKTFSPLENKPKREKKQILHLSCFADVQKNISGILRVLKRLSKKRQDFECVMIGDGVDFESLKAYSDELALTGTFVRFAGLKENKELAKMMADAEFMIMFSNHENLPVVILESYACGVPVISTRVGGIHEHLNDDLGILTEPKDEDEFFNAIDNTLDHLDRFDKDKIRKYAVDHFSNEVIGNALFKVYSDIKNK